MSSKQKGVCDLDPSMGIADLLSDEQQRRWEDKKWANKMGDPTSTYDRTRAHLNFEVAEGGKIQAIDTSKTIMEKYQENLETRGIKDPNKGKKKPTRRILASMILSGSTARMQQLAFGNQQIDFSKGADNSHLTRNKEIEEWARDTYNFIGKRYGHQNIVSFYVHLDESWVHAHCTLIPINQQTNKVSYDAAFEARGKDANKHLIDLHTSYAQEVGSKWGLERGEPVAETKAEHVSNPEYKKKLVQDIISMEGKKKSLEEEIRDCERKIKSFTTMLNNLQLQKENIERLRSGKSSWRKPRRNWRDTRKRWRMPKSILKELRTNSRFSGLRTRNLARSCLSNTRRSYHSDFNRSCSLAWKS